MKRDCTHLTVRHEHGTQTAYLNDGCRCDDCRADHTAKARARRRLVAYGRAVPRSVPNIGSRRRIEALMTLGWSMREISRRLGFHEDRLNINLNTYNGLSPANAARIAAIYDQLWDSVPPATSKGERIAVSRTKALARRRGYLPPLAWDDDTIDDPAAKPSNPPDWTVPRELRPCGTLAAARRHQRAGEPLCPRCADAQRLKQDVAA